ncbi:MAG: hypothetical protein ABIK65_10650 [Candidatus Eisenbacteria bacterium]
MSGGGTSETARPPLGRRLFSNTAFALADRIGNKAATTIAFVLLVRLLPPQEIAVIGIATGYLALAAYLEVGPIRVLLRDYPKIAADRIQRDRLLTALFSFWGMQSAAMVLLFLLLRPFVFRPMDLPGLSFLYLGMLADFIALSLHGWIKTVFYADFRQPFATKLSLALEVPRLLSYGLLLLSPSLVTYSWILIVVALLTSTVWAAVFARAFRFRPRFDRRLPSLLGESLNSYGLWDHLNRVAIETLLAIDAVVLSWFALSRIGEIGDYTVALRFVSLFFLVPMQLHVALQLALANLEERPRKVEAIGVFLKANTAVTVGQLLFLFLGGGWLLRLLFGTRTAAGALPYALLLGTAVSILNFAYPFLSVVNNQCRLRSAFFRLFLPALVVGMGLYSIGARFAGPMGIAWANIAVYGLLTAGIVLFTLRCFPFRIEGGLFGARERKLFAQLLRGRR